jgi:competence protein ComEC
MDVMAIIYVGLAWFFGLWLASLSDTSGLPWLPVALGCFAGALVASRYPRSRDSLLLLGILCLGAARFTAATSLLSGSASGHISAYNGRNDVTLTGLVAEEPRIYDTRISLRLKVDEIQLANDELQPVEGLVLIEAPRYPVIEYGTSLEVVGRLEAPPKGENFDYRGYLARQGIHSYMKRPALTVLAEGEGNPLYHAIYKLKSRVQEDIQETFSDPQASLLSGILLGNDDGLSPELQEQFRVTGLTHIIAISGFNIAILAAILLKGSQPVVGRRWSTWVALIGITLYTILVGAQAPVVRATIMGALFIVATRLMGQPTFAPAGLFTAGVLMTLVNPFVLWDVGFQLSFTATLGLMLYTRPMSEWTQRSLKRHLPPSLSRRLSRLLSDVFMSTLAAMILTLPLMLAHFGQLSLISPLSNFLVLPAQPGIMAFGILAAVTGLVSRVVAQIPAWIAWLFLSYTIGRVRLLSGLSLASIPVSISTSGVVALYALIFGLTWLGRMKPERRREIRAIIGRNIPRRIVLAGGLVTAILLVTWLMDRPDGKLHINFFDVGQGDATFIQTPSGRQILIDGGAYPSILTDHLGREMPFFDRDIDLVIVTHPDGDHVAGLPAVLQRFQIGQLINNGQMVEENTFQALIDAAAESNTPIHATIAGEVIHIEDGVRLEILNPAGDQPPATSHQNDQSVALRLTYGNFSLLLTGDAGEAAERAMLSSGRELRALVYKAGHHGAKSSSGARFLQAINPQYVIISAGEENRYGHPHQEVLQRVEAIGAAVLRTDELGSIEIITDGQAMWWEAQD